MSPINAPRHYFGSTTIALMFSFHRMLLLTVDHSKCSQNKQKHDRAHWSLESTLKISTKFHSQSPRQSLTDFFVCRRIITAEGMLDLPHSHSLPQRDDERESVQHTVRLTTTQRVGTNDHYLNIGGDPNLISFCSLSLRRGRCSLPLLLHSTHCITLHPIPFPQYLVSLNTAAMSSRCSRGVLC